MLRGSMLAGLFVVPVVLIVCAIAFGHSPDLQPAEAMNIISLAPEFKQTRSVVNVSATTRGVDSLKDCCYDAEFTFVERGSTTPVKAGAEFRYWKHGWHLQEFHYGEPKSVEMIWILSRPQ